MSNQEEILKICHAFDVFLEYAAKRMLNKMDDGFIGWTDPDTCNVRARLLDKVNSIQEPGEKDEDKNLLDISNFAMMLFMARWNEGDGPLAFNFERYVNTHTDGALDSLRTQLSALTEERDRLKMEVECEERRFSDLWEQFCSAVAERDRYREALEPFKYAVVERCKEKSGGYIRLAHGVQSWFSFTDTKDALQKAKKALSLPTSAVREAEREVIKAAEECEKAHVRAVVAAEIDDDEEWAREASAVGMLIEETHTHLYSAVRALRSLREG